MAPRLTLRQIGNIAKGSSDVGADMEALSRMGLMVDAGTPPLAPRVLELTLKASLLGKNVYNRFDFQFEDEPDMTAANALAADFEAAMEEAICPRLVTDYAVVGYLIKNRSVADGFEAAYISTLNGAQALLVEGTHEAIGWRINTDLGGRPGTGYKRWGGIPDGAISNGAVVGGEVTAWESAITAFEGIVNTGGRILSVVSDIVNGVYRTVALVNQMTGIELMSNGRTQVSRRLPPG